MTADDTSGVFEVDRKRKSLFSGLWGLVLGGAADPPTPSLLPKQT